MVVLVRCHRAKTRIRGVKERAMKARIRGRMMEKKTNRDNKRKNTAKKHATIVINSIV